MSGARELIPATAAGLVLSYASPARVAALTPTERSRVLGCVLYSADPPPATMSRGLDVTHVPMPLLGTQRAVCELWSGNLCVAGHRDGIHYRHDGELLFGWSVVDERTGFERSMRRTYDAMLDLLEGEAYPTLLRVWNFLPAINDSAGGEERYRQFNRARQDSLIASGRSLVDNVPAACALGLSSDELPVVYFIASRGRVMPFENPRQMRASDYPPDYGARSPVFSRACLAGDGAGRVLFLSGTASIRGHATHHPGDVARQTRETLVNIQTLLDSIDAAGAAAGLRAADLAYKVYLRDPGDYECVRGIIRERLGSGPVVVYTQADICRSDLLVEIEAAGRVSC